MARSSRLIGKHIMRWEESTTKCTLDSQQEAPLTRARRHTRGTSCSIF